MSYGEHPNNSNKPFWAMFVIGLILTMFLAGKVKACDSYEDCMNPKITPCEEYIGSSKDENGKYHDNFLTKPCEQPNYQKAIAYKLNEINNNIQKLDGFSVCNNDVWGDSDCADHFTNKDLVKKLDEISKKLDKK